jgi:hypothetical protein
MAMTPPGYDIPNVVLIYMSIITNACSLRVICLHLKSVNINWFRIVRILILYIRSRSYRERITEIKNQKHNTVGRKGDKSILLNIASHFPGLVHQWKVLGFITQTSPLCEMRQSCKCFPHVIECLTLTYNCEQRCYNKHSNFEKKLGICLISLCHRNYTYNISSMKEKRWSQPSFESHHWRNG